MQGYAEPYDGLEVLERRYAEHGRKAKKVERVAELEKDAESNELLTRIVDLLEQEVSERKRLAKRVVELETLIKERDQ